MADKETAAIIRLIASLKNSYSTPIYPDTYESEEERLIAESLESLRRKIVEDRSENQQELLRCRERYGEIIENTPVGVCITNSDGIYEYVNKAYTKIYGYNREELTGAHFTKVVPLSNRDTMVELHDKFLGRQYELKGEWEVVGKGNRPITILANAVYMVDSDGEAKKVTFVTDISDRKKAEKELADTVERLKGEVEERKKLEKARDQMERMVRHDMKNPLNGIMGVSQLLMQEELSEYHRELISLLTDSSKQLLSMIDNFGDYQQMEEGTYQLKPQEFEFAGFIEKVCSELGRIYTHERIDILCRINGTPVEDVEKRDYTVAGEPLHLKTVFENLIRNAYEASVEGDTICVDVFRDTTLRVEIHNRASIPEEIRDTFFQRYVTYGKERGTGMGTYIAKMIMENHGGTIDFESDKEKGTTVFIELPLVQ